MRDWASWHTPCFPILGLRTPPEIGDVQDCAPGDEAAVRMRIRPRLSWYGTVKLAWQMRNGSYGATGGFSHSPRSFWEESAWAPRLSFPSDIHRGPWC